MNIDIQSLNTISTVAEKAMREHKVNGLAMTFIKGGKRVMSQCMGYSDTELNKRVDDGTYFEAASLTKPFFARLVFMLEDEGVIDLSRPLTEYSPTWVPSSDERFKRCTATDVLSHATGLPNWGKLPMQLLFEPSHGFGYSGMGYYYLQGVIEKLTSTRLDDIMQRRIMDPLNMDTASLIWTGAMRHSLSRTTDENGVMEPMRTTARHSMGMEPNCAFSLYVTVNDYAKFVMSLMQERDFASRVRRTRNAASYGVEWGLGWGLYQEKLWHWGDNGGFKSFVCFDADSRDGLVIHTNGYNGLNVCYAIARAATGDDFDDIASMISEAE